MFPDPSPYKYDRHLGLDMDILAVGWLHIKFPYNTGPVSEVFLDRLKLFCSDPALLFFEIKNCPLCLEYPTISTPNGDLNLGSGELRILGQNKVVYASPCLIYHYVNNHNYQPPQEFIDAILNFSLPNTKEYQEFVNQWRE